MATNTTGFIINKIQTTASRFELQVTYYYNYNLLDNTWINTETYTHDIPIIELNVNYNTNTSTSAESCEINGKNKCLLRYTSDMIEINGSYNSPAILYNYIVNNLL